MPPARPSALLDMRVIYCGLRRAQSSRDCLEQLRNLPDVCVDLIYISQDPPFNSNRNYEVFWGETSGGNRRRPLHYNRKCSDVQT